MDMKDGQWVVSSKNGTGYMRSDLPPEGIYLSNESVFCDTKAIGYRYRIQDKSTGKFDYAFDSGVISDFRSPNSIDKYNVFLELIIDLI